MGFETEYGRALRLLQDLCRELARLGCNVGIRDARPCVSVSSSRDEPLSVLVDTTGKYFVWNDGNDRHLADDTTGAAATIAAFARRTSRRQVNHGCGTASPCSTDVR